MKKIGFVLLLFILALSFTACGHEHVFGEWVTVKEATCTEEGVRERTCECGEKETEVIPMADHTYEEKVIEKKTCTKDGVIEKTCKVCGKKEESIDKAEGHDFSAATVFLPKICKVCGKTEGAPLSEQVKMGQEKTVEGKHSFTLDSDSFTSDLKEKRGSTTYRSSFHDQYVYAVKMTFKNLSTESFERWGSNRIKDVKLQYKGEYNYEGEYWCPVDDIVPLKSDTVYLVFVVPESMSTDTESSICVAFTIDDTVYSFVKQKGSDKAAKEPDAQKSAASGEEKVSIGKEYTDGSNHSFVFKDLYYTSDLSVKNGSTTYHFGEDGYYLVFKLDLKNLKTESLEQSNSNRFSDIKLTYDGLYNYEGKYRVPVGDIVPLGNDDTYIYFEVPKEVETGEGKLNASFTIDGKVYKVDCRAG